MFDDPLEVDRERTPQGSLDALTSLPPGIMTAAALLTAFDVDRLSGRDQVLAIAALQRLISHLEANRYEAMAALYDTVSREEGTVGAAEVAASEVGAELRLTRRAADVEMALALELRSHPRLAEALRLGRLDVRRVRVILEAIAGHSRELADDVVERVLVDADALTTGQLRALLRRLVIENAPDAAAARYENAVERRKVVAEPDESGSAHLYATDLPPHRVAAALRHLTELAHRLKSADEKRSIDQLRADCMLDLLCGNQPQITAGEGRAVIDIRIDLTTLIGLNDKPADLAGYGPVIADIARSAVHQDDEWRYTVTNDVGGVIATGVTTRRPTTAMRRHLESVYRRCVFPGCRVPARRCDLDHTIAWADGGATTTCNLTPLCRHHHTLKHTSRWTYRRLDDGTHLWTSPHGRTYTSGTEP